MAYYTDPWEQPVSQMRRELMQHTDVALARHSTRRGCNSAHRRPLP